MNERTDSAPNDQRHFPKCHWTEPPGFHVKKTGYRAPLFLTFFRLRLLELASLVVGAPKNHAFWRLCGKTGLNVPSALVLHAFFVF